MMVPARQRFAGLERGAYEMTSLPSFTAGMLLMSVHADASGDTGRPRLCYTWSALLLL